MAAKPVKWGQMVNGKSFKGIRWVPPWRLWGLAGFTDPHVGLEAQGQVTSFKMRLVSRIKDEVFREEAEDMGDFVTWNSTAEGGR